MRPDPAASSSSTLLPRAFRYNGFGGVTIDDIGGEVGIVGPALYRYFDNQADILVATITRLQEWLALEMATSLRGPNADDQVISSLVRGYISIAMEATDLLAAIGERFERARADYVAEWRIGCSSLDPMFPTHKPRPS